MSVYRFCANVQVRIVQMVILQNVQMSRESIVQMSIFPLVQMLSFRFVKIAHFQISRFNQMVSKSTNLSKKVVLQQVNKHLRLHKMIYTTTVCLWFHKIRGGQIVSYPYKMIALHILLQFQEPI